ncbi:DUF7522 family protein [Halopiger thermotolerans]
MSSVLDDSVREMLVRACRTAIGEHLRSIVYFTPNEFKQIYLRDDLRAEADIKTFVENERAGFDRQETYTGSELGKYQYTIHGFDDGFLLRVVADDRAVFVTTDQLSINRFEEAVTAIHNALVEN